MFIEVDDTCSYIYITNRKPVDRTKYVLKADPEELDNMRRVEYDVLAEKEREKKLYDNKQMDRDEDYFHMRSSASCHVDDIVGFHFGGSNARFWMLRKHFNAMTTDELKYIPFYSWQCITL